MFYLSSLMVFMCMFLPVMSRKVTMVLSWFFSPLSSSLLIPIVSGTNKGYHWLLTSFAIGVCCFSCQQISRVCCMLVVSRIAAQACATSINSLWSFVWHLKIWCKNAVKKQYFKHTELLLFYNSQKHEWNG